MELSKITELRIAVQIKNIISEFSPELKDIFYIENYTDTDDLFVKLAVKAGITNKYGESGKVNIIEYIDITFDDMAHRNYIEFNNFPSSGIRNIVDYKLSDSIMNVINNFERENIKSNGPSETLLGELFRALQYIEYRAINDGDLPWLIGSPNFISYMFVLSTLDEFNYGQLYDYELNKNSSRFTENFLLENTYHKLDGSIESTTCGECLIIRAQLMDLYLTFQLKDTECSIDSRNYTNK